MMYYTDPVMTGRRIKELCKEKKVTVAELSDYLEISCQSVYKWLSGKSLPDINNLIGLSKYLDVPLEGILVYYASSNQSWHKMQCQNACIDTSDMG